MSIVIVPNSVRDAIYAKIDEALKECPDAVADRDYFYQQLLEYFDNHGVVPEFSLMKVRNGATA